MKFWLLCVLLWGCSSAVQPAKSAVPAVTATIHADVDYTPEERLIIARAVDELKHQADYTVVVVYDLNYNDIAVLTRLKDVSRLTRITSGAAIVRDMDIHLKATTYGWMSFGKNVYVIQDRMSSDLMFQHVLQHELLHVLGADHVKDPNAVLYEQTDALHMAVVLTEADREAIRRARAPY